MTKKTSKKEAIPDAPLGLADGPSAAGWHKVESGFRCFKEYQYGEIRGITNPQADMPDPFAIGQMMHVGKAHWFSKHFSTDETVLSGIRDRMLEAAEKSKLPMSLDAQRSALRYFTEYVEHYRVRAKPKVLAAEYDIGPAPLDPGDPEFLWRTARLDDVSWYPEGGGALFIGEAKTTSTSVNDAVNQYSLHGQPMLQALLWKVAPQGEAKHGPIAGVMLDVIVKGYGGKKSTFARLPLPITQRALDWYAKNFRQRLRQLANVEWDTDVPRNIQACTRMVGRSRMACPFRDLCMHGRSATTKYVFKKDGSSLLSWKPTETQTVNPWD